MNSFLWAIVVIGLVVAFNSMRSKSGRGSNAPRNSAPSAGRRKPATHLRSVSNEGPAATQSQARLEDVRDPTLAASILMIQLVRTGAPVTSAEKSVILSQMSGVLKARSPEKLYDQAWAYTENRALFSQVSGALIDVLKGNLSGEERLQLIEMLEKTANAYTDASEMQEDAIIRLKKRLMEA